MSSDEGALDPCVEEEVEARGVEGRRDAVTIFSTGHLRLLDSLHELVESIGEKVADHHGHDWQRQHGGEAVS